MRPVPPLSTPRTWAAAGYDNGNAIAVDSAGSAYVAGVIDPNPSGGYVFSDRSDAFVAKLNPAGSAVVYSVNLGGSLWDRALGIAVAGQRLCDGRYRIAEFPDAQCP